MRDEAGRNGHLKDNFAIGGGALDGDECTTGADVDSGAEFEHGTAIGIGSVYKNGKCDWEPLPASGLALGFAHD